MNASESKVEHLADYEWAIQLNRSILNAIGLWPSEEQDVRKKFVNKFRTVLFLSMATFVCTIPCFCSLIKQSENLFTIIDNLGYSIPLSITVIKFIMVYSKKKALLPIVNMIAKDWAKLKTELERSVMIRRARVSRMLNMLGYMMVAIATLLVAFLPKFGITIRYIANGTDMKTVLPLPTYYIYDVSESPYFEILYVVQAISLGMLTLCYCGVDHFFGMLVLHICGQLENLRTRLANIKRLEVSNQTLTAAIQDHVRLIRAVDVIESTFTLLLLILMLYFGTFTCIYGLMAANSFAKEEEHSMFYVAYFLSVLLSTFIQIALCCIAGQILVSESEGVHDAAYECDWASLRSNNAKDLILIMARAKKPLCLTAGKLFPVTTPTLCNILKISLSCISLLLARV